MMRLTAVIVLMIATVVSAVLFFHAGQRTPPLLLALMAVWVFTPYVALGWANVVARRWPVPMQSALYWVTVVVSGISVAVYADDAQGHRRPQAAFVWVIVPPLLVMLIALTLFTARRRAREAQHV